MSRWYCAVFGLFAFWGVGVVFEASRGLWTVSWDDDRTQELASGAGVFNCLCICLLFERIDA